MKRDYCSFKELNTKLQTDLTANSATSRFVTICRYRPQICQWNASLNSDPLIARWKVCVLFLWVSNWRFLSCCLPAFGENMRWWLVSTNLILMFRQTLLTGNFQGEQPLIQGCHIQVLDPTGWVLQKISAQILFLIKKRHGTLWRWFEVKLKRPANEHWRSSVATEPVGFL